MSLASLATGESSGARRAGDPVSTPTLSICVPTWNRARYLDCLLGGLAVGLREFPYSVEVFISDNGSTDATSEVVERHRAALPIRYMRHAENRGPQFNSAFVLSQARGTYYCYVADDDLLDCAALARAVRALEADPAAGALHAPWRMHDLVEDRPLGQFYSLPQGQRIERGDHAALLELLLRHQIFPEIFVARTALLRDMMPRVPDAAFFAFVHSAEILGRAAVLLSTEPFYVSITRYFADDAREQLGTQEAEHAWDRYRGGLEVLLARCCDRLTPAALAHMRQQIDAMIGARMAVAVRLRLAKQRDAIETYYIAQRAKALGAETVLPAPMQVIGSMAALQFLATDARLRDGGRQVGLLGPFASEAVQFAQARAAQPLLVLSTDALDDVADAVLLVHHTVTVDAPVEATLARHNVTLLREADLTAKFPC